MTKTLTVEDVEREIRKMDPNLNGRDFKIAVLLMSALQVEGKPTIKALRDYTAYPDRIVRETVMRALDNGIFLRDGRIAAKSWFEKDGGISFWLDVCCCAGLMQKVPSESATVGATR